MKYPVCYLISCFVSYPLHGLRGVLLGAGKEVFVGYWLLVTNISRGRLIYRIYIDPIAEILGWIIRKSVSRHNYISYLHVKMIPTRQREGRELLTMFCRKHLWQWEALGAEPNISCICRTRILSFKNPTASACRKNICFFICTCWHF